MDLQALITKAEQEIEKRKLELTKREAQLDKREEEITIEQREATKKLLEIKGEQEKLDKKIHELKQLEAINRTEDELNERVMFIERKEKEAAKLFDQASTTNLEAERVYGEAKALKAKIDKEATEFKAKLVSNLQEMINKA